MATNNSFDKASPRLHTSRDSKFPLEMTMNRLRKAIPLLAAIISFVLIAATGLWAQKTIHVPSDVTTIQAAIEASQDGDTVLVSAGTYFENINFQGKAITLTSVSGPASTVIDGGAKNAVVTINTGEGPKSVLSGFTIRNGNSFFYGGGIEIVGSSPTITGNTITGNHAVGGVGIDISRGSPLIENNVISDNTQANGSGGGGGGIQTSGSELEPASPTIIGNLIVNNNVNAGGDGGGIFASYYGRPTITNNFVQGNSAYNYGGGISIWSYDGAAVTQNVVVGNKSWGGGSGAGVAIFTFRTYLGLIAQCHST